MSLIRCRSSDFMALSSRILAFLAEPGKLVVVDHANRTQVMEYHFGGDDDNNKKNNNFGPIYDPILDPSDLHGLVLIRDKFVVVRVENLRSETFETLIFDLDLGKLVGKASIKKVDYRNAFLWRKRFLSLVQSKTGENKVKITLLDLERDVKLRRENDIVLNDTVEVFKVMKVQQVIFVHHRKASCGSKCLAVFDLISGDVRMIYGRFGVAMDHVDLIHKDKELVVVGDNQAVYYLSFGGLWKRSSYQANLVWFNNNYNNDINRRGNKKEVFYPQPNYYQHYNYQQQQQKKRENEEGSHYQYNYQYHYCFVHQWRKCSCFFKTQL